MSTGRGRSWRPEKTRRTRETRKLRVRIVSGLLIALVGVVVYLLTRPAMPALNVICIVDDARQAPAGWFPVAPNAAADVCADQLNAVVTAIHELNPQLVNPAQPKLTLRDIEQKLTIEAGQKLVVYLNCDARVAPDPESAAGSVLELVNSGTGGPPLQFGTLLASLQKVQARQIVLLLDLHGPLSGLSGDSLANDCLELIERDIATADVPGLTVISAASARERSWEYFETARAGSSGGDQPPAADSDSAQKTDSEPQAEVHGTVFARFVSDAFSGGHVDSADMLFSFLNQHVGDWVQSHYGETQTVTRIGASGKRAATAELLARMKLPSKTGAAADDGGKSAEATAKSSPAGSESAKESGDSGPEAAVGGNAAGEPKADDTPAARLARLLERRKQLLQAAVIPAALPADWIGFQNDLFTAEAFVAHGRQEPFDILYDQKLVRTLRRFDEASKRLQSVTADERLLQWICLPVPITPEDRLAFQAELDNAESAGDKTSRLPPDLRIPGPRQRAFVTWFTEEFHDLSSRLPTMSAEDQAARITPRVLFLRNLTAAGWKPEDRPHQFALLSDLLTESSADWYVELIPVLDRLLQQRLACLRFASGVAEDGSLLRRETFESVREELQAGLERLTAAERWLAAGRTGLLLAKSRLDEAEAIVTKLRGRIDVVQRLTAIQDLQVVEFPLIVQFLAGLQETTELSKREIDSAEQMATAAVEGHDVASAFPAGLLNANGFGSEHATAMFALTRSFRIRPPVDADALHYQLLQRYLSDRLAQRTSSSERQRRLSLLEFEIHPKIQGGLLKDSASGPAAASSGNRHTGLWLGFWSIRMLEALEAERSAIDSLWLLWKDMIIALRADDQAALATARVKLASRLRTEWRSRLDRIGSDESDTLFTTVEAIRPVVGRDLQQHFEATRNASAGSAVSNANSLYAAVHKSITGEDARAPDFRLEVANPSIELDASNRGTMPVNVLGATELFVLNDGLDLTNSGAVSEANWHRLALAANGTSEAAITEISVAASSNLQNPLPLLIAAVNSQGIMTALRPFTVFPSSETDWEIEFLRADGRKLTLVHAGTNGNTRTLRLTLLPTTKDPESKEDPGSALAVRLRRVQGIARKVRLQLINVRTGNAVWSSPRLVEIDDGTSTAVITLPDLPAAPAGTPAAAAAPVLPPVPLDFSDGFRFEITPEDVLQKSTTAIEIRPEIVNTGAERFVRLPVPVFRSAANVLEFRVERSATDLLTALQPEKIPIEISFSRAMNGFLVPGGSTKTQNVPDTGQDFQFRFTPAIEQALFTSEPGAEGLEFGIGVAGIPSAWQWKLVDGQPVQLGLDRPEIRVDLSLENEDKLEPVRLHPRLVLGKDWTNAVLRADVHFHGVSFDKEWFMDLNLRNVDSDQSVRIVPEPILVRRRQVEHVTVSPGEGDVWTFRTDSRLVSRLAWNPKQFNFQDGRYEVTAQLHSRAGGELPIRFSVPLIVDATPPELPEDYLELTSPALITKSLTGTIRVRDPESGIAAIRVGLDKATLKDAPLRKVELTLYSETAATAKFEIQPSEGFPFLEQKEDDNLRQFPLYIEIENGAKIKQEITTHVTFVRPGKRAEPMKEAPKPGSITVKFASKTPYDVSVTGPTTKKESGSSPVILSGLEPGTYIVEWQTSGQGRAKDKRTVRVGPGETKEIDASKK